MLSEKIAKTLNDQINAELFSSYLYLSMSAYFESTSLGGCAQWMRLQAQEEMEHAVKIFDYINERGGRAIMEAIEKPATDWNSPLHVFEDVVKHEQKVTALINSLVDCAVDERDHATKNFLEWFVAEQVEEEANVGSVCDKMRMVEGDSGGLFALDLELGKRVLHPDQ